MDFDQRFLHELLSSCQSTGVLFVWRFQRMKVWAMPAVLATPAVEVYIPAAEGSTEMEALLGVVGSQGESIVEALLGVVGP